MNTKFVPTQDGVFKRILWLYGLFMLLSNAAYLLGYYLLPEGFMRDSPPVAIGERLAASGTFWSEFALTFLYNLGVVVMFGVLLNLIRVKGFPLGYLWPIGIGILTGLISGSNSFAASDLKQYNAWDGMALNLSIGGLEILAYVLIITSTISLGVYQYASWWQWKSTKVMNLRDVRLSKVELLGLMIGILLLIVAAYRETAMRFNM